jgi:hypothetical protein
VVEQLSQDLVLDWLEKKAHGALLGEERPDELSIMGLTTYQPFDGSNDLKIVRFRITMFHYQRYYFEFVVAISGLFVCYCKSHNNNLFFGFCCQHVWL